MKNITVVKWISYDESGTKNQSVGGMGGWFTEGKRWADFIAGVKEEKKPYYEALRKSIIENGIRGGGNWHQTDPNGIPLFSDDTVGSFSYRSWGDLLAAVWSTEDNKDYHYMDYYMS